IVQAAGRAMRQYNGKECGYIVVPLVVPEKMDFETFAETTAFRQVAQTLTALSTQDERIADEFRAIESGWVSSGKIVEIEGDVPVGMKMKLSDFAKAISTRMWESIGRANWRKFEDARVFARSLDLKSVIKWKEYCQSGEKPADIPYVPSKTYLQSGWSGYGDWLGTGAIAFRDRQCRPFKKARAFARSLKLKSSIEWSEYCQSGKRPKDIPSNPNVIYDEWSGYGDCLGRGGRRGNWRRVRTARAFSRSLNLKSGAEWYAYAKTRKKPDDIPVSPKQTYEGDGWAGMGDWLGTGRIADQERQYRTFKKARAFARSLDLKSETEWR